MLGCFPGPAYDLLNQRLVLSHYSFFNCSFWEIKAGTLELFETAKFFLSGYSFSEPNVRRFFSLDKSPIFYAKSFFMQMTTTELVACPPVYIWHDRSFFIR